MHILNFISEQIVDMAFLGGGFSILFFGVFFLVLGEGGRKNFLDNSSVRWI